MRLGETGPRERRRWRGFVTDIDMVVLKQGGEEGKEGGQEQEGGQGGVGREGGERVGLEEARVQDLQLLYLFLMVSL